MRATLRLPRATTYEDYLAVEDSSGRRHEFIDGVIVAMAGGSFEHNAIAGRLAVVLGNRVAGECRYFTPDQRFWIAAHGRGRYTDGSILCGKPARPTHDGQAATNPTIVFEVLSPSSEGDDAGEKLRDFQTLASLRAYVLLQQDARVVRVFRRDAVGGWSDEAETYRNGETFALPALTAELPVDDIYFEILDADGRSLLR